MVYENLRNSWSNISYATSTPSSSIGSIHSASCPQSLTSSFWSFQFPLAIILSIAVLYWIVSGLFSSLWGRLDHMIPMKSYYHFQWTRMRCEKLEISIHYHQSHCAYGLKILLPPRFIGRPLLFNPFEFGLNFWRQEYSSAFHQKSELGSFTKLFNIMMAIMINQVTDFEVDLYLSKINQHYWPKSNY